MKESTKKINPMWRCDVITLRHLCATYYITRRDIRAALYLSEANIFVQLSVIPTTTPSFATNHTFPVSSGYATNNIPPLKKTD